MIFCEESVIRYEIMKDGVELGHFAELGVELLRGMTVEERERYKEEGLYKKSVGLQEEREWERD